MVPLSVAPASSEAAALASWQTITRERGVLVSTRDEAGRQFPSFRGIGRVDGSVWEIIAVLEDADHAKDWMHDCNGSALLEKIDSHHQIIYNRTDAPWPVADRDIVLESTYQVTNGGKEIWAKFKQTTHTKMPVVNGIVRMPTLEGHYHVVAIDDSHSLVEYRVNADPGGALPDWLVTQTTKDLPLETLVNLRARVKTMRGQYDVAGLKSTNGF
jgi:hypothetical protein